MHYDEYYELTEKTGWRITDLDWDQLARDGEAGLVSDFDRAALQGTAVIEYGVPHYAEVWSRVRELRRDWELWQFTTLWTGEEHRHSYSLSKACRVLGIASGITTDLDTVSRFEFAAAQKQSCPEDCYSTVPGMLAYAMIQELVTNRFYTFAAKQAASPMLKELVSLIAGDEMRHHVFFRDALRERWEASSDRAWFSEQIFRAARAFKMPHLIYKLQEPFFEGGDWVVSDQLLPLLAKCFSFDLELLGRLATVTDGARTSM